MARRTSLSGFVSTLFTPRMILLRFSFDTKSTTKCSPLPVVGNNLDYITQFKRSALPDRTVRCALSYVCGRDRSMQTGLCHDDRPGAFPAQTRLLNRWPCPPLGCLDWARIGAGSGSAQDGGNSRVPALRRIMAGPVSTISIADDRHGVESCRLGYNDGGRRIGDEPEAGTLGLVGRGGIGVSARGTRSSATWAREAA